MEQQWSDLGSCCRRWVVPSALRKCNRFWALLTTAATLPVHAGSSVMCEFEAGRPLHPQGVWNPQADVVLYAQAGHLCWTVECRTVLSKKSSRAYVPWFCRRDGGGSGGVVEHSSCVTVPVCPGTRSQASEIRACNYWELLQTNRCGTVMVSSGRWEERNVWQKGWRSWTET